MSELKNICEALGKAQGAMSSVHRNKNNPHFKAKYASLDDIIEMSRPILSGNGLSIIQTPLMDGQYCGVQTKLYHSSGEMIDCGSILLPLGRGGGAQGAGSSITYARRYALSAVLLISCDDDDDGNAAQASKPAKAAVSVYATEEQIDGFKAQHAKHSIEIPEELLNVLEEGKILYTDLKEAWIKTAKENNIK